MPRDIEKRRASQRNAQNKHTRTHKGIQVKRNSVRRSYMRTWLDDIKSTLHCKECGESHPACIQFHHKNPTEKEFEIGAAINRGYSKDRILKEIEKCEVLCANCHMKLHYIAGGRSVSSHPHKLSKLGSSPNPAT